MRKTSRDKQSTLKKKATDFVYLSTKSYLSRQQLLTSVAVLAVFASLIFEASTATKDWLPSLIAGVSLGAYIWFVWMILSGRIKNTFPLRFLVNGISIVFLSVLLAEFVLTFVLLAEPKIMSLLLPIGMLYILFSLLYVATTVIGVHAGAYGRVRRFNNMPAVIAVNAVLSSLIPVSGAIGMLDAKISRFTLTTVEQSHQIFLLGVVLFFICALGHVNFVQYYYCIKYSILCDENGDTTSPKLIPAKKSEAPKNAPPK